MLALFIIGLFLFVFGIIGTTLYFYGVVDSDGLYWTASISLIVGIIITCTSGAYHDLKRKSIEYSSNEYRLEIKVTEFQGVKDTTYVLIPKED